MRVLLDTSVLIAADAPGDVEAAVSAASLAELRFGVLVAAERGGRPRRRAIDLAIAATANVHGVPLLTHGERDFALIEGLVDLRAAQS